MTLLLKILSRRILKTLSWRMQTSEHKDRPKVLKDQEQHAWLSIAVTADQMDEAGSGPGRNLDYLNHGLSGLLWILIMTNSQDSFLGEGKHLRNAGLHLLIDF